MRLEFVAIENINFDDSYQRPLDNSQVRKISKNLMQGAAKAVSLSERSDGALYCYDGQHTVEAFKRSGKTKIPAVIVKGSQEKEAKWFLEIQQNSKRVFVRQAQKAGVVAKDEVSLRAKAILERYGIEISKGGTHVGKTGAIGAIRSYSSKSPETLTAAMDAIEELWKDEPEAWCSVILRGMFEIAKEGRIKDVTRAAKKRKVTPRRVLDVASAMQSAQGQSGSGSSLAKKAIISLCGLD